QRGDLPRLRDATGPDHVRHHDLRRTQLEYPAEGVAREQAFTDAEWRPHLAGKPRQVVYRVGRHRFLEPHQVVRLEGPSDAERTRIVPHSVELDRKLHTRAGGLADGAHRVDALIEVGWTDVLGVGQ